METSTHQALAKRPQNLSLFTMPTSGFGGWSERVLQEHWSQAMKLFPIDPKLGMTAVHGSWRGSGMSLACWAHPFPLLCPVWAQTKAGRGGLLAPLSVFVLGHACPLRGLVRFFLLPQCLSPVLEKTSGLFM